MGDPGERVLMCVATRPEKAAEAARAILESWPDGHAAPRTETLDLEDVRLFSGGIIAGVRGYALVLVDVAPTEPAVAELLAAAAAAVALWSPDAQHARSSTEILGRVAAGLTAAKSAARHTHHHSALVLPADSPPPLIAGALLALWERWVDVSWGQHELAVSRAAHDGLRRTLDQLHEELQTASSVQREFLPRELPVINGISIGVLFRPCGYVSGDIYDVRRLDEDRVGIFIADAVGHGVPAALFTMSLTRSLRMHEAGALVEPAVAMQRLNEQLCDLPGGMHRFATAVYGIVDARAQTLTFAGAGHPYPLLFRDGVTMPIESDGLMLGVELHAEFTQTCVHLCPGDALVVHSDGLESAFPHEDAEDSELCHATKNHVDHLSRLCGTLRTGGDARGVADRLAALMNDQRGSLHQTDDVTAIVVGVAAEAGVELAETRQSA
jgi:phosphoserine phosphatase RsbU/P